MDHIKSLECDLKSLKEKYAAFEVGCSKIGKDGDGNEDHGGQSYTFGGGDGDLGGDWLNVKMKNDGDLISYIMKKLGMKKEVEGKIDGTVFDDFSGIA